MNNNINIYIYFTGKMASKQDQTPPFDCYVCKTELSGRAELFDLIPFIQLIFCSFYIPASAEVKYTSFQRGVFNFAVLHS